MARTKWSLLKAAHVSPDPSTKYGEEVEEGTPTKVVHIRNNLVIFPKEDDGKTVPICTKFKCRWAHLAGEGIWGVFSEKVGLMMDPPRDGSRKVKYELEEDAGSHKRGSGRGTREAKTFP